MCFAATVAAIVCLVAGHLSRTPAAVGVGKASVRAGKQRAARAESLTNLGYMLVFVAALAIFVCCAIIVEGFFTHNVAIQYVAQNYPEDTGSLFWLYKLSGRAAPGPF